MTFVRSGGALVCLCVALTACSQVLRLDDFVDAEPGAGGASGATSATSGTTATTSATSASSGGGTGGDGGSTACEPGESQPCYEGPAGTADIGVCKSGTQTCLPDGSGFGSCDGQVFPGVEDCATRADEDCVANCGEFHWALALGGGAEANTFGSSVIRSPGGGAYAIVNFAAPVTIQGTVYTPDSSSSWWLLRADTAGSVEWVRQFVSTGWVDIVGASPAAAGDLLVYGTAAGTVDFGNGVSIISADSGGGYIAKMSEAGDTTWAMAIAGGFVVPYAAAQDVAGNLLVSGAFQGTMTVGAFNAVANGEYDCFVLKLDPSGNVVWLRSFGGAGYDGSVSLGVDAAGSVVVGGTFSGTMSVYGTSLVSLGNLDGVFAKFDALGAFKWAKRLGGPGGEDARVAVAPSGDTYLLAFVDPGADLDGTPLASIGSSDILVAKADSQGAILWSDVYGSQQSEYPQQIGLGPDGAPFVSGTFSGVIDFGVGPVVAAGALSTFVASFDASGVANWSRGIPTFAAAEIGLDGSLLLAGSFQGNLDLGGPAPLVNSGNQAGFLAKVGHPGL